MIRAANADCLNKYEFRGYFSKLQVSIFKNTTEKRTFAYCIFTITCAHYHIVKINKADII